MTFEEWHDEYASDALAEYTPRELGVMLPYEINEILNDAYREFCEQEQEYLELSLGFTRGLGI